MVQQIKNILFNDKDKIITVLEKLNCHKINPYYQNQIRCALPDGETGTSVQIILTDFLPAYVYSRSGYDSYEIKDIISLVQFLLKSNFATAIKWLCEILEIEYDDTQVIMRNQSETIKLLKKYVRQDVKPPLNNPMSENFLNKYPLHIVKEWVNEGIEEEIQRKYGIRIDKKRNRWLIPIRDKDNRLITVKGRSYLPNTKELDIPKYLYYKENKEDKYCNNILFGLNHNYKNIKKLKEVIVVEGEKTVMKADSMGFDNVVDISGHDINKNIKKEILKLQVDVVLALDKDIAMSEIMKEGRKLSMFANVYYVFDKDNLLSDKDSPFDRGFPVWLQLYDERKRLRS